MNSMFWYRSIVCLFCVVVVSVVAVDSQCVAQSQSGEGTPTYLQRIQSAQEKIEDGQFDQAIEQLAATTEAERGFEYHYLHSLAQAEGDSDQVIQTIPVPKVQTRYGIMNPVNRQMAFICRDGGIRVHDLANRDSANQDSAIKEALHSGGSAIWTGVFSHDGTTFASGHENGDVVIWDAQTWTVRKTLAIAGGKPVRELALAPDGNALVVEGESALELWSLKNDEPEKIADVGERFRFGEGLDFSPIGDKIATGGMFDIDVYDSTNGKRISSTQHASYTMGLKFSPDGKKIASAPRGNINKFLGLFDLDSQEGIFNAGPFKHYINGIAFSPDGKRIAATGCEKLFRLFDAGSGDIVLAIARPVCGTEPVFSRDGKTLGWSEQEGYKFIDLPR